MSWSFHLDARWLSPGPWSLSVSDWLGPTFGQLRSWECKWTIINPLASCVNRAELTTAAPQSGSSHSIINSSNSLVQCAVSGLISELMTTRNGHTEINQHTQPQTLTFCWQTNILTCSRYGHGQAFWSTYFEDMDSVKKIGIRIRLMEQSGVSVRSLLWPLWLTLPWLRYRGGRSKSLAPGRKLHGSVHRVW